MSAQTQDGVFPPARRAVDHRDGVISPLRVFGVIERRKYSILSMGIVLSCLAVGVVLLLKPAFMATTSVLMEERKPSLSDIPTSSGTIATDAVAVRTQVDILRVGDLARAIVRQLHLVDMPEFSPHPGLARTVLEAFRLLHSRPPPGATEREQIATRILLGMTAIVNDGRSYVIEIRVRMTAGDAADVERVKALSAELANAYADAYVQFTRKVKSDHIRLANSYFDERMATLEDKMREAQHAVQAYRIASGLVEDRAASGEGRAVTVAGQQMAQISTDLVTAISDRAQKEAALDQLNLSRTRYGDFESVPEVVASPLIQRLREQQVELGAREAGLAMSRGPASSELAAVHAAERDVAAKIVAEAGKVAASLSSSVDAARARESMLRGLLAQLQAQVAAQGQTEIRLIELQNAADTARQMYSTYLKKAEETANEVDMQEPDALVVSRAAVPLDPAPPTTRQLLAVGVVFSFLLATLVALVRERLQSGFRTAEQLEASLGIGTLGLVPKVPDLRDALCFSNRHAAFSEAIASIRAVLHLNMRRGVSQAIMVSSALPQEGKTFFAASLARNAALAGERVLLIDCDLRRPAVAKTIAAAGTRAMEVVADIGAWPELSIRRDSISSLDIATVPSGPHSPQDQFASPRMRQMMDMLRQRYDLIVLDAPPVLAVSDARVLAGLADVTVMVVCWQKTPQQLVSNAVTTLRASGARVAGTVITQVKVRNLTASGGNHAYVRRDSADYLSA